MDILDWILFVEGILLNPFVIVGGAYLWLSLRGDLHPSWSGYKSQVKKLLVAKNRPMREAVHTILLGAPKFHVSVFLWCVWLICFVSFRGPIPMLLQAMWTLVVVKDLHDKTMAIDWRDALLDSAGISEGCEHDCRRIVKNYLETLEDPDEVSQTKVLSLISPHTYGFFVPQDDPLFSFLQEASKANLTEETRSELKRKIQEHLKTLREKASEREKPKT